MLRLYTIPDFYNCASLRRSAVHVLDRNALPLLLFCLMHLTCCFQKGGVYKSPEGLSPKVAYQKYHPGRIQFPLGTCRQGGQEEVKKMRQVK